ncbi:MULTISPECIES: hypothetical protein [unclassified Nodularia (in: cyanobacteria)]|uniref:hypothetical protein n=1 Tax=unclassified Nodularia (in: cyanobacteria) TaxID=2656917 RepID=UPI001882CB31|nr:MULTISPECIES: hypothetical protein [unclassified Nodularia (in: cyanobacteria)]MBE9199974.1 hypothetical protein [Nodularia sp. LEGE 06071]MCC2693645.1 hypothetical protein [Nodularia sp. LEGE 04288]
MSQQIIQPDLFVDLSPESQELISGGQQLQLGGQTRPDITVIGTLIDSSGQRIPVRIFGFAAGPPSGGGGPFGGGGF